MGLCINRLELYHIFFMNYLCSVCSFKETVHEKIIFSQELHHMGILNVNLFKKKTKKKKNLAIGFFCGFSYMPNCGKFSQFFNRICETIFPYGYLKQLVNYENIAKFRNFRRGPHPIIAKLRGGGCYASPYVNIINALLKINI